MLQQTSITTRDILRNYKNVFATVNKTKQPAIVMSRKKPLVAIVTIEDLKKIREFKQQQTTKALLGMAGSIPKGSGFPADASEKHDEYAWD